MTMQIRLNDVNPFTAMTREKPLQKFRQSSAGQEESVTELRTRQQELQTQMLLLKTTGSESAGAADETQKVVEAKLEQVSMELRAAKGGAASVRRSRDRYEPEKEKPERIRNFVSKKEKYKDYQSTGLMFMIVAVAGITLITLNLLGIITIYKTSGASSVLFYCVMYAMFAIFIFVGFSSFKSAAKIKEASVSEEAFLRELNHYIETNITTSLFDFNEEADMPQEELYFKRTALIRSIHRLLCKPEAAGLNRFKESAEPSETLPERASSRSTL